MCSLPYRAAYRRGRRATLPALLAVVAGLCGAVGPAPARAETIPAAQAATTAAAPAPPSAPAPPAAPPPSAPAPPTVVATTAQPAAAPTQRPLPRQKALAPARKPTGAPRASGAAPTVLLQREQRTTAERPVRARVHARRGAGAPAAAPAGAPAGAPPPTATKTGNGVALPPQLIAAQAQAFAAALAASAASVQALGFYRIPLFLLPIYKAAAARYGVPWQILAAINEIETNYGTDLSVSSAGALGWMQFMPQTWLQYGVDALNAGYADPYNPVDAIFAAARYLRAAGAATDLRAAILAYNHSEAYVDSVLLRARLISSYPSSIIATLTGLDEGRVPLTGAGVSWQAQPAAAAPSARRLRTALLTSAPNAAAVAVQDGRIVALGHSRTLGRFVVLQDTYGNEFIYGSLGALASSYPRPGARRVELAAALTPSGPRAPAASVGAPAGAPFTLAIKPPPATLPARLRARVATQPAGKLRLYAHPRNPDAAAAAQAVTGPAPDAGTQQQQLPLRVGALVSRGTVLGRVNVAPGGHTGNLRFAIRPAGDSAPIDPLPVLSAWAQLAAALHPQGAKASDALSGATASDVPLLSPAELARGVLSDPAIELDPRTRRDVAAGALDRRALALLTFLSRDGLALSVSAAAGESARGGGDASQQHVRAIDIWAVDGAAIAGHQGAGTIADLAVRTLLTLPARIAPQAILSLMRYPGAPRTHASPLYWNRIHVSFAPPARSDSMTPSAAARTANATKPSVASAQTIVLSAAQWEGLLARIGALASPSVAVKPSSAAIADPK